MWKGEERGEGGDVLDRGVETKRVGSFSGLTVLTTNAVQGKTYAGLIEIAV